jgi:hypothetical protein
MVGDDSDAPATVIETTSADADTHESAEELPVTEEPAEADAAPAEAFGCEDLIGDVVGLEPSNPLSPTLLQIYNPKEVSNKLAVYAAGDLRIPKGAVDVVVLECEGTGSFNDTSTATIRFYATVDVNDDSWVGYEVKE